MMPRCAAASEIAASSMSFASQAMTCMPPPVVARTAPAS
jgi:hypothetical protein